MFELWGMAVKSAPVAADVSSSHFQRSSGYMLSVDAYGSNCMATLASELVKTTRWRFAPAGIELHSQPIRAVNSPGRLFASAVSTASSQTLRLAAAAARMRRSGGFAAASATSVVSGRSDVKALRPSPPSTARRRYHSAPQVIARSTKPRSSRGRPSSNAVRTTPRYSAWSATTRKSSGVPIWIRARFPGWTTGIPRANR